MRTLVALAIFAFSFSASAFNAQLLCKPVTRVNAFDNFTLNIDGSKVKLVAHVNEASGIATNRGSGILVCNSETPERDSLCSIEAREEDGTSYFSHFIGIDIFEFAGVRMSIGEDDEGHYALTQFVSDGPAITSFHRCKLALDN